MPPGQGAPEYPAFHAGGRVRGFQFYSLKYIRSGAPFFEADAMYTYPWYSTIIGLIVLINCIEMIYIRVAVEKISTFPFFKFRPRVTGQDRLVALWKKIGCAGLKKAKYHAPFYLK